jgi:predicted metal-dependent phosphoesterase TrpH
LAAREQGVGTLALTDHDTTDGLAEALDAGRTSHVDVIPGVEINTDVDEHEVHVLGYFIEYTQEEFQAFLRWMRAGRLERAERMVEKLRALGVPVEWGRVREIAAGAAVGRPHVARALVEVGWVGSPQEAFARLLPRTGPAYVPRVKLAPEEAVETILRAGGVPVLAHPGWTAGGPILERLPDLVQHGLCGIEVYYPDHTPVQVSAYLELARQYGLVATGGTDYHGGGIATRVPLGSVEIPPDVVPALRARWAALHARSARGETRASR